jgi:hypothetical protein
MVEASAHGFDETPSLYSIAKWKNAADKYCREYL